MRIDHPYAKRAVDELRAAGVEFSDQHDARLHWLERECASLRDQLNGVDRAIDNLLDGLERLERRLEGEELDADL